MGWKVLYRKGKTVYHSENNCVIYRSDRALQECIIIIWDKPPKPY